MVNPIGLFQYSRVNPFYTAVDPPIDPLLQDHRVTTSASTASGKAATQANLPVLHPITSQAYQLRCEQLLSKAPSSAIARFTYPVSLSLRLDNEAGVVARIFEARLPPIYTVVDFLAPANVKLHCTHEHTFRKDQSTVNVRPSLVFSYTDSAQGTKQAIAIVECKRKGVMKSSDLDKALGDYIKL
jgi:hypothetical protein